MAQINAYLTFAGNCREAMSFYRECLGGQLTFQTIGELFLSDNLPCQIKEAVLHATLINDFMVLMGSDMVGDEGLVKGNAVSLMLHCSNENETRSYYKKLASGGAATYPPENNYHGNLFGVLIDRYGHHWLLSCNSTNNIHHNLNNNKNLQK